MTDPSIAPRNISAIHELMVDEFPTRYVERQPAKLRKLLALQHWDPDERICDYDNTYFEAHPVPFASELIGTKVLGLMHRMSKAEIERDIVEPFVGAVPALNERAREFPIVFLNGHRPDLQAALTALAEEKASAHTSPGNYQRNLMANIRATRVVATRGFMPIRVNVPYTPVDVRLAGMARLVFSPHFTFPKTEQMLSAGLPPDFVKDYNHRAKEQMIVASERPTGHPLGFNWKWVMAPNAGPDQKLKEGDHAGDWKTQEVVKATVGLLQMLGVGAVPVYSTFGLVNGTGVTKVEIGKLIEPGDVNQDSMDRVAADQAEFRRVHGNESVYYAKELAT